MLNLSGCVNLCAAAGSNGSSEGMVYDENEQSIDSAGTDVQKRL
jgi:hypothetical protein